MPALQYSKEKKKEAATSDQDLSLVASIRKLSPPSEGTIRLFDRQDYYQAFSSCAVFIATQHFKTQTVLKHFGKPSTSEPLGLPSVTLTHAGAITFLRDALTTKQLRIEIFIQERGGGGGTGNSSYKWKLSKEASPGNLSQLEDLLFSGATGQAELLQNPVIMAIRVKANEKSGTTVGIAFADTSAFELGVSEYNDSDLFSNTESLLIQLGVKEVLITPEDKSNSYDLQKLKQLIERCNIVVTERKKSDFNHKDVEQDLNRLLRGNLQASSLPEFDQTLALSSLSALISYLSLLASPHNFGAFSLKNHDLSQFMKLDASALRALNLMPDPSGSSGSNKNSSVFGLLNRCKTAQGTRTLAMWLKQPLINLHSIRQRQELIDCLIQNQEFRQTLIDTYLKFFPDFHRISKRFQKQNANLEDVVRVYQAVVLLPGLVTLLENGVVEGDDQAEMDEDDSIEGEVERGKSQKEHWKGLIEEMWLNKLRDFSDSLSTYQQMVETTIDLSELSNHNYVIKPEFDDSLIELKDELETIRDGLDEIHNQVAKDLGMETDGKVLHFEANSLFGYCFRLTRKEATAIKNKKRYIELKNQTNGVHFTTKDLKELVEQHRSTTKEYEKKQSSLVKEVIQIASSYCQVFETLNHVIAHLDVITSLATSSLAAPQAYVKPTVFEQGKGSLNLVEARHPCLEVQEGVSFIPNDCHLERDVSEFSIITGPNAGGKSVFIRQTALICLLAQIGSFVPCQEASLPIFDSILCRVGAGDSQLKGVSTFMAEMLETSAILKSATKDSLVIIDELGRGTSTYDGFGLAWAISEHLSTVTRASVLFATHFHELTALAQTVKHVKNLHVVAHVEENSQSLTGKEITLLYKVAEGICDQSFGIHVAQLANFPEEVVKLAQRKADDLEDFGEGGGGGEQNLVGVEGDETIMKTSSSTLPSSVIAEGTHLVEQFLSEWSNRTHSYSSSSEVVGEGDGDQEGSVELEKELESLKEVYKEWKDRLETSQWVREVLSKTA